MLRYLHWTGAVLGIHRVTELARIREGEDAAKRRTKASGGDGGGALATAPKSLPPGGGAGAAAPGGSGEGIRRFNLEHLTGLLDRWSFHNIVNLGK
jgi:hypothetical protein